MLAVKIQRNELNISLISIRHFVVCCVWYGVVNNRDDDVARKRENFSALVKQFLLLIFS